MQRPTLQAANAALFTCSLAPDVLNAGVKQVEDDRALAQGIALSHGHSPAWHALPSQSHKQPKNPPCIVFEKICGTTMQSSEYLQHRVLQTKVV